MIEILKEMCHFARFWLILVSQLFTPGTRGCEITSHGNIPQYTGVVRFKPTTHKFVTQCSNYCTTGEPTILQGDRIIYRVTYNYVYLIAICNKFSTKTFYTQLAIGHDNKNTVYDQLTIWLILSRLYRESSLYL